MFNRSFLLGNPSLIVICTIHVLRKLYIHTYIHKLYLSSDFSVAYIASISDPNLLIKSYNIII